ncbi:MAG: hypothetical protein HKM29_05610, partial [Deltaproteobacteria bacterium]|nr:hypothetical protein [Deltaproteobacteria bacterium]
MNPFQTVVGIDPSGNRLVLAAVRGGFGPPALCAPPLVYEFRSEKEQQLLSETEEVLGDFAARHGLAGSTARLCIPADRIYSARVSFPPIREKDMRPALELELERLFPFPSSRLRFGWKRLAEPSNGKNVTLIVTAAPSDYIEWWEDAASRTGLRLAGAIPAGWALASSLSFARRGQGEVREWTAILREVGEAVECSVLSLGVPVFSAYRRCAANAMPAEGLSLLEEGLIDVPSRGDDEPVDLLTPPGWFGDGVGDAAGKNTYRVVEDFAPFPVIPTTGQGGAEENIPARVVAGAFGAAVAEKAIDLAAAGKEEAVSRLARVSAWTLATAAVLLALAWPATLYWKTKAEISRLDAEIAALRPVVTDVEKAFGDLNDVEEKISLLREAAAGRGEPFFILKELTDRLPDGTWLTGLRVEDRKVEMDGLSPSANEI